MKRKEQNGEREGYCCLFFISESFWVKENESSTQDNEQLMRSITGLSAPSCLLLGKINPMGTFFSTRQLSIQSKWMTMMEITDVTIAFILPSRWQNGGESLGMETTSCLW